MKPRVAIIAYNHLTRVFREVLAESDWPIDFVIYDALNEEAAVIARELEQTNAADVVISSGGNAVSIQAQGLRLPLVRVMVTGFDLMHALWLAKRANRRAVVMSYREPIPQLDWFRDLFRIPVSQEVYTNVDDAQQKLYRILQDRRHAVIGASLICELTERMGGYWIFLYSKESVRVAVENAVDLAVQRRAEIEKREKTEAIMRSVNEGILYVDLTKRLREINPAAERILGVSARTVIGKPVSEVFPACRLEEVIETGKPELNVIQKHGSTILLINRMPVVSHGNIIGAIATFQEAQSVQRAEKAVRQRVYAKGLVAKTTFEDIVGESLLMRTAKAKAYQYAQVDATVLIQGETGTGKELFAQSIHNASPRRGQPFVAVNCAALPEPLLESELFGYEEGAFTGARKGGKPGLFELAHGGTLFLDEVGEMSLPLQARLLRVLQEKEVMRIGGDAVIPIDVRIVAATHRDLRQMVKERTFREDLYYRLNVLTLELPPLRKRLDDLPLLLGAFFQKYRISEDYAETLIGLLFPIMTRYTWPGNVRELENLVERLAVLLHGGLRVEEAVQEVLDYLDKEEIAPPDDTSLHRESVQWQRQRIQQVLREVGGNKTLAAKRLGVSRSTLWRKLKAGEKAGDGEDA